ncbi:MAG: hypothetical protein AABX04_02150 [Nanoarchaeota archaeon]
MNNLNIEQLTKKNLENTAKVLSDSFLREPMVRALEITPAEMLPVALQACELAIEDELSLVMKTKTEIIGCLISYDYAKSRSAAICASSKFDSLFDLLAKLNEGYRSIGDPVLYQFMLGVEIRHKNSGIGSKLIQANIELGRRRGYGSAKAEATGPISQRILIESGYIVTNEIIYSSFSFNERLLFSEIDSKCKLMQYAIRK